MRVFNNKIILVYVINSKESLYIIDALLDLKSKKIVYKLTSELNNYGEIGTFKWNDNILEIRLNDNYYAEIKLGQGELYHMYNSNYSIEFGNGLRGLSSLYLNS